jgi:hypothetical protein
MIEYMPSRPSSADETDLDAGQLPARCAVNLKPISEHANIRRDSDGNGLTLFSRRTGYAAKDQDGCNHGCAPNWSTTPL